MVSYLTGLVVWAHIRQRKKRKEKNRERKEKVEEVWIWERGRAETTNRH